MGANTNPIILTRNQDTVSIIIQPVFVDGTNMAKGNSVMFNLDLGDLPGGTEILAPLSEAQSVLSAGFRPMLDRGDGTYELRFKTGADTDDFNLQIFANPSTVLPVDVAETFVVEIQ